MFRLASASKRAGRGGGADAAGGGSAAGLPGAALELGRGAADGGDGHLSDPEGSAVVRGLHKAGVDDGGHSSPLHGVGAAHGRGAGGGPASRRRAWMSTLALLTVALLLAVQLGAVSVPPALRRGAGSLLPSGLRHLLGGGGGGRRRATTTAEPAVKPAGGGSTAVGGGGGGGGSGAAGATASARPSAVDAATPPKPAPAAFVAAAGAASPTSTPSGALPAAAAAPAESKPSPPPSASASAAQTQSPSHSATKAAPAAASPKAANPAAPAAPPAPPSGDEGDGDVTGGDADADGEGDVGEIEATTGKGDADADADVDADAAAAAAAAERDTGDTDATGGAAPGDAGATGDGAGGADAAAGAAGDDGGGSGSGKLDPACMDDLNDPAFQAELTDTRTGPKSLIWFIRTSAERALGPLDACAVASAVEHNPAASVLVLSNSLTCRAARAIHPDLRIVRFTYDGVFARYPPLASWYRRGVWKGAFDRNNLGNALRLALLHAYGGVYLDTDVLSLRPMVPRVPGAVAAGAGGGSGTDGLPPNFIGVERDTVLNNAAIGFTAGHPFVDRAMARFVREFKKVWGWNGPALLTRTWAASAGGSGAGSWGGAGTKPVSFHSSVSIRPQHEFYAIPFSSADDFFKPLSSPGAARWLKSFEGKPPVAVHVWNKKLKAKMKGIGKAAAAAAAAAATAGGGASAEAAGVGDGGENSTAAADEAALSELGAVDDAGGAGGGPSFVEYLMRHACPTHLARAHPALVAAVDAVLGAPPSLPHTNHLGKHALWLLWPPGRTRRVAWAGTGTEPLKARRTVVIHGGAQLTHGAAGGDDDDTCAVPAGGTAWSVGCGASVPLPYSDKSSYSWTATVWFKITPAVAAGGSDPTRLAPASCPALRCATTDCDVAAVDVPPHEEPAAGSGGGGKRGRRGRRSSSTSSGLDLDVPHAFDAANGTAGGAVSFLTEHGRLALRFPYGSLLPVTKVNVTTATWRSVTLVYDSKQRRVAPAGGGSVYRSLRQTVSLYLDGMFVSTRHSEGTPLNATLLPTALLLGRVQGSDGGGGPRVLLGGATVYLGHLNDHAVLELHTNDVVDAITTPSTKEGGGGTFRRCGAATTAGVG